VADARGHVDRDLVVQQCGRGAADEPATAICLVYLEVATAATEVEAEVDSLAGCKVRIDPSAHLQPIGEHAHAEVELAL
jgi:hypothetical protein